MHVLKHVPGRQAIKHILGHMHGYLPSNVLKHMPEYVLKHVPKHMLRHVPDKHVPVYVLKRIAQLYR